MSEISRRDFARLAGSAGIGAWASSAWSPFAIAQGAAKVVIVGGGAGGATVAHYVKKDAPELDVTLIEANPIYSSSFFSNLYHRRLPHAGVAQPQLRRPAPARRQGGARLRHRRRCRQEDRQDARRPHLRLRPARAVAGHRHQVRLHPRLFARGLAHHAARLHDGGGRQAAAQAAARRHARRRHGGDGDAQQSLPLPARPLRARLHDRALPQDQEAEVEARHPRSQEGLLQAAGVHRGLRQVLQGHHRAEPDDRDRRLRGRRASIPRPRRSSPRPARR